MWEDIGPLQLSARIVVKMKNLETVMNKFLGCAVVFIAVASANTAEAKGCVKGAVVGGIAGHYAGHHAILGAAAGCVVGHHEAKKRAEEQKKLNRQN